MWEETQLEKQMKEKLSQGYNHEEAEKYYTQYCSAKDFLIDEIFSNIPSAESQLTDHTEKHIEDVMKKAFVLICDEMDRFNAAELYLLCMCILFHDCGNIHGRDGHEKKIADVYDEAVGAKSSRAQEKRWILSIVRAHSGLSRQENKDTLVDVLEGNSLYDKEVKLREIAGILRFADELAEGPQRTSDYIQRHNYVIRDGKEEPILQNKAIIYHKYASVTNIYVDKGNGRVALTYHIEIPVRQTTFSELINYIYKRIVKLDAERRYCKYYTPVLEKLKRTEARIFISCKGEDVIDLPPIELGDKYALTEESVQDMIFSRYENIDEETLKTKIKEKGFNYDEESI